MTAVTLEPTTTLDPTGPCRVHLMSGGVSVLVDLSEALLPSVVHWGAELPGLVAAEAAVLVEATVAHRTANDQDVPMRTDVLGSLHTGWSGRPGLVGDRDGARGRRSSGCQRPGWSRRARRRSSPTVPW